jgi:hypothetical protein
MKMETADGIVVAVAAFGRKPPSTIERENEGKNAALCRDAATPAPWVSAGQRTSQRAMSIPGTGMDGKVAVQDKVRQLETLMKPEAKHMFKSPRWLLFYASLGMAAVGYCGFRLFEHASNTSHEHFGINDDDILAFFCFLLALVGVFLCVISFTWIIISAALSYVRRIESKQPRLH